jgi:DNA helicase-2/ATP-dependent DNA helicase PcrA
MSNDIEIIGGDEYPPTASVKLHGPPGTGKTTQTMERLKALITEEGYSVADIAFVTYRKTMAERFLERLEEEELIGWEALKEPWQHDTRFIGTLHAVCNRMTDLEAPKDGNRQLGGVMHEFCREEYGVPYYKKNEEDETSSTPGELMFSARSWCIENEVDFSKWHRSPQYEDIQETWPYYPELSDFHENWEAEKEEREIADFEDMLLTVKEENLSPPRQILAVDEMHDFTPLQDSIVTRWIEEADIVIANGDPLQVVYNYKGADPRFFTELDLPEVLLPQSYRVPRNVWDYACEALRPDHEPPNIEPKTEEIDPEGFEGEVLDVLSEPLGDDRSHEGRTPGSFIEEYGEDIMFLVRTRPQQRDIGEYLKEEGVIFNSQEGGGGWNHANKRMAVYNILASLSGIRPPNPKKSGVGGQMSFTGSYGSDSPFEDVEGDKSPPSEFWAWSNELRKFFDILPAGYIEGKTKKNFLQILGGQDRWEGDELSEHLSREFWEEMTNGADSVEHLLSYDGKGLVARALRRYENEEKRNSVPVKIQTIHASKGGEAETVVLYDGIPPRTASEISNNEEEARNEARVWYVGCTRASNRLIVARNGWDWVRDYLPKTEREKEELKEALQR